MNKLALIGVLVFGMSGCASQPEKDNNSDWQGTHQSVDYILSPNYDAIASAVPGQSLSLTTRSQRNYNVTIVKRYFAASGRECLEAETQTNTVVLCDYRTEWGLSRAFDQF
jgi:starvation-inducible outer membrane lipoprotein